MCLSQTLLKHTNRLLCILQMGKCNISPLLDNELKFGSLRVHEYLKQMNEEVLSSEPLPPSFCRCATNYYYW
jgi:hypothetical protein